MAIRIEQISYGKGAEEIIAFRNRNRDDVRDRAYFDWRYLGRPNGKGPIIVAARAGDGSIIGSLTTIPHHYVLDRTPVLMGVTGDISVSEECRGQGIAGRMLDYLVSLDATRDCECCVVLPNPAAARPLEKSGWTTVSKVHRYVKILDTDYMLKGTSMPETMKKCISAPLNMTSRMLFDSGSVSGGTTSTIVREPDADFDSLWNAADIDGLAISTRNSAYLRWRYHDHPLVDYSFLTIRRGRILRGYIVFHELEDSVYIDDLLCLELDEDFEDLMLSFFRHIRQTSKASVLTLKMSDNRLTADRLKRFGFFKRDHQDFMVFRERGIDGLIGDAMGWYLTTGDKDI